MFLFAALHPSASLPLRKERKEISKVHVNNTALQVNVYKLTILIEYVVNFPEHLGSCAHLGLGSLSIFS